jgi:hypothetical protein
MAILAVLSNAVRPWLLASVIAALFVGKVCADRVNEEECRAFATDDEWHRRAHRSWAYFAQLEARWDRQPGTGLGSLA